MASKFLTSLGKKEILAPHLDKWFRQDFSGHDDIQLPAICLDKPRDDFFHPSTHAVGCARLIYSYFDPELETERFKMNAKVGINGHMWHGLIQHIVVEELGFATWDDIEHEHTATSRDPIYRNAWMAKGAIDIDNLQVPDRDGKYIVDIKTENPQSFMAATPPDYLWNKYQAQLQLYLDWSNTDLAIMLRVQAANPFNFKEIHIQRDPEVVKYIYDKWDLVAKALKSGTIPPHTCVLPKECKANVIYDEESVGSR